MEHSVTVEACPGLLHEGSPILVDKQAGVVQALESLSDGSVMVKWCDGDVVYTSPLRQVRLRLATRTGQAHVGWYISENFDVTGWGSYLEFDRLGEGHYAAAVASGQGDFLEDKDSCLKLKSCFLAIRMRKPV